MEIIALFSSHDFNYMGNGSSSFSSSDDEMSEQLFMGMDRQNHVPKNFIIHAHVRSN
jgi:hypothetical protein